MRGCGNELREIKKRCQIIWTLIILNNSGNGQLLESLGHKNYVGMNSWANVANMEL